MNLDQFKKAKEEIEQELKERLFNLSYINGITHIQPMVFNKLNVLRYSMVKN